MRSRVAREVVNIMKHSKQKLKILICEEDSTLLEHLKLWVQRVGEEPVCTDDALVALSLFREHKPDIFLFSEGLKSMGGLELLEKIKKIEPNIATIFMLNDASENFFSWAIDLEVDKYLMKPIESQALFRALETLSKEKIFYQKSLAHKRMLEDYKDAIDLSFSVSRHNLEGDIIYVNDLFYETLKISFSDAMSGVINPLKNDNEDMELVWKSLKEDHLYRERQIFKLADKSERILDITAVALKNEKDEVYEYLVFSDNVTDIIYAARKIKNQELDNRLAKLNHAKELNEVKDTFLTIFTHELKTPLNSIINFSQYVSKHLAQESFPKKERLLTQVEEINRSGRLMLEMISNLMEAIKLKDANISLNIEPLEIINICNSIKKIALNPKNIEVELLGNQVAIYSDETRLRQIVDNIFSNALKYAASKVQIAVEQEDDLFRLEIMDDGEGFSDAEHLFNLFEQSDADSLTREATGTGVGLFIVKQLCDRMSYDIELTKSETLGGAKVVVRGKRDIRK